MRPQTRHAPSGPITPTHVPSSQRRRLGSKPEIPGPAFSCEADAVAAGAASGRSSSASSTANTPGGASAAAPSPARPHSVQRPLAPRNPVQVPSGHNRRLGLKSVCSSIRGAVYQRGFASGLAYRRRPPSVFAQRGVTAGIARAGECRVTRDRRRSKNVLKQECVEECLSLGLASSRPRRWISAAVRDYQ